VNLETATKREVLYDSAVRLAPVRGALRDLYSYRALIRLLVARDLTVRYKRSLLGVSWTILNPLLTTLVMWVVFKDLFHASVPGVPYIVYILVGMLVITYFQQGVFMTSASIVSYAGMLTKVYVPPVVFACSTACSGAINFVLGLFPLVVFELVLGPGIPWTFPFMAGPLVCLLAMIAGLGLIFATFAIRFDDVLNLINVLLLLTMYVTPIFYPITIVPVHLRKYFLINPMFSYVTVFRYLAYSGTAPTWKSIVIVILSGAICFFSGLAVFVRRWPSMAALL